VNPATLGTPCLVPVQVDGAAGSSRGFITRLSPETAAVSSDPALQVGEQVTLRFSGPASGTPVEVAGTVREELGEGGLWRGRPAALVELDEPLGADVLGSGAVSAHPQRRGSEAVQIPTPVFTPGPKSGMSGSLRTAGLGRRRITSTQNRPPPTPVTPSEPDLDAPSSPLLGQQSAELELPGRMDSDENTAPPRSVWLTDPETPAIADPLAPHSGEIPPIQATDPELPSVFGVDPGEAPPAGEDDLFGLFGKVSGVPEYSLPPGAEDSSHLGAPTGRRAAVEVEEEEAPEDNKPKTTASGYFDVAGRGGGGGFGAVAPDPPMQLNPNAPAPEPPDDTFGSMLDTGGYQDAAALSDAPPIRNTMSLGDAPGNLPPWEADAAGQSLIPRNARIASSLNVTFWARGRSHTGTAQNFSKEGLYIAFAKDPPVRGAIVRVEFPVQGDGDPVPIRFNAEVRWQSGDRPGHDLPDGFGVQILTFESPKDRIRYDEVLLLILSLHQQQTKREKSGFKWGKPGEQP